MNLHTLLVLAAIAEFLAAVSIISTVLIWLTQKFPSDELNRTAVGRQVHTMKARSGEDEASIKAPIGHESESRDENRSEEIDPGWPAPILRPE
jgi:hypothetical protein